MSELIIESLASFSNAMDDLARILYPPSDTTLDALQAACDAAPRDEAALLVLADRLDELDRPFLAGVARWHAAQLLCEREVFDAIIKSFGVPAHLLSPNGTPPTVVEPPPE